MKNPNLCYIQGWKLLTELPEYAGNVVSMCNFQSNIIIATENGCVFIWDNENQRLEEIMGCNSG